jgi:hypothetical protein
MLKFNILRQLLNYIQVHLLIGRKPAKIGWETISFYRFIFMNCCCISFLYDKDFILKKILKEIPIKKTIRT